MSWLKRPSDSKDHELFPMCNVFQLPVLSWESRHREGSLEGSKCRYLTAEEEMSKSMGTNNV